MFTSIENRFTEIMDNPPSGSVLKGRVIRHDSYEIFSETGTSVSFAEKFLLETGNEQFLVFMKRKARISIKEGMKVWVIGHKISDDRFSAEMIVLPEMQVSVDFAPPWWQRIMYVPTLLAFIVGVLLMLLYPNEWIWYGGQWLAVSGVIYFFFLSCYCSEVPAKAKSLDIISWEYIKSRSL